MWDVITINVGLAPSDHQVHSTSCQQGIKDLKHRSQPEPGLDIDDKHQPSINLLSPNQLFIVTVDHEVVEQLRSQPGLYINEHTKYTTTIRCICAEDQTSNEQQCIKTDQLQFMDEYEKVIVEIK